MAPVRRLRPEWRPDAWRESSQDSSEQGSRCGSRSGSRACSMMQLQPWDESTAIAEDTGLGTAQELRRDRLREGARSPSPRSAHEIFKASLCTNKHGSDPRSTSWDGTLKPQSSAAELRTCSHRERSRELARAPS